ncbi:unnamed protein product [Coregonus sp. 'balchen']|nr:unnamed protein product [Coregonus sp. 'balchen']
MTSWSYGGQKKKSYSGSASSAAERRVDNSQDTGKRRHCGIPSAREPESGPGAGCNRTYPPQRFAMGETKIIYHLDDQETPYLVKLPIAAERVTLADFKNVLNKPNYTFFFKSMDDDFG